MSEHYEEIIVNGQVVGQRLVSDAPTPEARHLTVLAFWNRLTQPERIGIDLASIDNPAADTSARQLSAALRDLRTQVESASYIDLDRADTQAGVQQLEQIGLLASGRAVEILDAPIQDHERPR